MIKSLTYDEKHNGPIEWLAMHENLVGKVLTIKKDTNKINIHLKKHG